jgi:hypothetical protein
VVAEAAEPLGHAGGGTAIPVDDEDPGKTGAGANAVEHGGIREAETTGRASMNL